MSGSTQSMFFVKKLPKQKDPSDATLIQNYKTYNDNAALAELFERYSHLIFCVCLKYLKAEEDSKDAVMEIFQKLTAELDKHKIDNFKGWLLSVTKNYCLMAIRSKEKKFIRLSKFEENDGIFVEYPSWEHLYSDVNKEELQNSNLEAALNQLNEAQRVCIQLFYFEEKTYRKIAETTGFEVKQVKSHIQNGKRNLKNILCQQEI